MIDHAVSPAATQGIEAALRRGLVRGDAAAASALPVLRHLVAADGNEAFGEDILARVRSMLNDMAAQLLDAMIGDVDRRPHAPDEIAVLSRALLDDAGVLAHAHVAAIEWQLTCSLHDRLALDPVNTPLVQTQIAEGRAGALAFLGAQASWYQDHQRFTLPLSRLPVETLDAVLGILRQLVDGEQSLAQRVGEVEDALRAAHAATADRIELARQVASDADEVSAVSVQEAGVAVFLTALADRSGAARDEIVLSTLPQQKSRFMLRMLAAGVSPYCLQRQVQAIHRNTVLPDGLDGIDPQRAALVLAEGHRL